MTATAAIYARISSDRSGDQAGVTRQLSDCEALAARRGWTVVERYVDDDTSAYSGKARPAYKRLLSDIKDGHISAVVVWHLDRLHRQPRELEEFLDTVDRASIRHLASVTGDVDLGTDDGRFMARILGAVARKESDDKSRRIKRKHEQLAQDGKRSGGGTRPYGYDLGHQSIRPDEAAVIKEAATRTLAGESLRSICNDFNDRGVLTVTGRQWSMTSLRRILMSGRVSGQREHRGEIVAKGDWPAILTPLETDRLRALLGDPSRRTNRAPRRYLLVRLCRCDLCGATLVSRPREDGRRRYVCAKGPGFAGCGRISIMADDLEELVVEAVLLRLDTPQLQQALAANAADDADTTTLREEVERDQAQLAELAEAYADRALSMPEWKVARDRIEERLSAAKKRLSTVTGATPITDFVGHAGALREQWKDLPLSRQRAIVAAVLDFVTVGPALKGRTSFDPDRVVPTWRL